MFRVLTKDEAAAHTDELGKEMQLWWVGLSHEERKFCFKFKDTLEQMKCAHEFREMPMYDGVLIECKKCHFHE